MSTKIVYILSHMPKPRKTAAFSLSSMEKVIYQQEGRTRAKPASQRSGKERKKQRKKTEHRNGAHRRGRVIGLSYKVSRE